MDADGSGERALTEFRDGGIDFASLESPVWLLSEDLERKVIDLIRDNEEGSTMADAMKIVFAKKDLDKLKTQSAWLKALWPLVIQDADMQDKAASRAGALNFASDVLRGESKKRHQGNLLAAHEGGEACKRRWESLSQALAKFEPAALVERMAEEMSKRHRTE